MTSKTPSEILTATVIGKLIDKGLLREASRKTVEPKMALGKIKSEDWKLELELAVATESKK